MFEANGIRFAYRRLGKRTGLPLVFNHHLNGNLDNWDPAILDGLAKEREVIIFNNAGAASSPVRCPPPLQAWRRMQKASSMLWGLSRSTFSASLSAAWSRSRSPSTDLKLIRKLILIGTATWFRRRKWPGACYPGDGGPLRCQLRPTREPLAKGLLYRFKESQEAGRAYLKRYFSRTENRDAPVNDKVAPAQSAAIDEWGTVKGERCAYLKNIKQPALVVSGNHDVIIYPVNALHLVQNMPNAKLIVYPDANHGSWYEDHEDFVFETNRFLNNE